MERASEALSVNDVYSLAEEIGKEFEILIDNYGVEPVNKLVTKVIRVLEYLEAYATKNDIARDEIAELRAQIYQLEHDKYEKAESRSKLEKVSVCFRPWRPVLSRRRLRGNASRVLATGKWHLIDKASFGLGAAALS